MRPFRKQQSSFYMKKQAGKGQAAAVAAGDAVQITAAGSLVKPEVANVEDPALRPGSRLPAKKIIVGDWGKGGPGIRWSGSGIAGTPPEFGAALETLLGKEAANAAGTVEIGSGLAGGFDSTLDLVVGTAVRVDIAGSYEIRLLASKVDNGDGTYTYTVDRDFSQAPADGAAIAAGVSYRVETDDTALDALPWLTVDQYEDGARYLCTDVRCRSLSLTAEVRQIITATLGFTALSCAESAASDPLTPQFDGSSPMVARNLTLLVAGSETYCKSFELSAEIGKETSYFNDSGISDLDADGDIALTGSFRPPMLDVAPITRFKAGTLADLILEIPGAAGNIGYIHLSGLQYDKPEGQEEEGKLDWNIPFTVTGGICLAFF